MFSYINERMNICLEADSSSVDDIRAQAFQDEIGGHSAQIIGGGGGEIPPTTYRHPWLCNSSTCIIPPPLKMRWALKKYPFS